MVRSVNDAPLASMVKDTDGSTVWSDGPWNKYDSDWEHLLFLNDVKRMKVHLSALTLYLKDGVLRRTILLC